jgi:hypothetical protein
MSQRNLQSIPPELRMMIFEYVLIQAESIDLSTGLLYNADSTTGHQAVETFRVLSLLRRQMRYEAESIIFAHNTFRLLANGKFPAIPAHYVEMMRNIDLYRTLIGKTFVLKIHRPQGGGVKTSVEVLELTKESTKERISQTKSQMETIIVDRLTQGAEVAARMIRRSVKDGEGMGMAVIQAIATQMNQQWIIAI